MKSLECPPPGLLHQDPPNRERLVLKSTAILLLSAHIWVAIPVQDPLDLPSPRVQTGSTGVVSTPRSQIRPEPSTRSSKQGGNPTPGTQATPDRQVPSVTPGSLGAPMGGPLVRENGPTQSRTMSDGIRERLHADKPQKPSESKVRLRSSKGPMQEDLIQSGSGKDMLDRVLERLGGMKAYRALDGIAVQRNLKANDVKGKLLFSHRFWHWARLSGTAPADEIQWTENFRYGRRGGRVWARSSDVDRPDLEEGVRSEVLSWSFLLRFPYNLRDRDLYHVLPEEKVILLGQTFLRMRVLDRSGDRRKHRGDPLAASATKDWVDLYLDPKELLPLFVEFHRDGKTRRVHLDQYKPVIKDGPLVPHRRTVLGEDGETPSLEITWEISKQRKWR
jgi:hypothetical protein